MHSIRTFFVVAAFAAVLLSAAAGYGASEGGQVYVVDIQKVLDQSIAGKAARNTIEADVKKSESKLMGIKSDLDKLRSELEKQSNVLSAAALEEKKEALNRKGRDLERAIRDQREELARKNEAEMLKVVEEIRKVVAELSSKGSYPIIMEKDPRVVIFSGERIDLTPEVLKILDQKKIAL